MIYDAVSRYKSGNLSMDSFLEAMGRQDLSPLPNDTAADEVNIFSGLDTLPTFSRSLNLLIDEAMRRAKGNQSHAARLLGISQSALNKRLKRSEKNSD